MRGQSIEARLASLTEATVELDTVWREILRPDRAGNPDERLVRRHERAMRQLLDADEDLRDVSGLSEVRD